MPGGPAAPGLCQGERGTWTGYPAPRGHPRHLCPPAKGPAPRSAHPPGTAAPAWHGHPCGSKSPLCHRAGERKPAPDKGRLFMCRRGGSGPGQRACGSRPGWGGGSLRPRSPVWDADVPGATSPDLPRPGAGGAGAEFGHPLHPQRGGLPLDRAHQAPPGRVRQDGGGGGGKAVPHGCPSLSLCPPQAHLGTCGFNVIPCPNRCSAKLSRRDLPEHVQHGCPKRRVKCEFCASDFTGEAFEVGNGGAGWGACCQGSWPWWGTPWGVMGDMARLRASWGV